MNLNILEDILLLGGFLKKKQEKINYTKLTHEKFAIKTEHVTLTRLAGLCQSDNFYIFLLYHAMN